MSPAGYSVVSHGEMIADEGRMSAYAAALRTAVRPGCVVLDIGAGTGIFSLVACQLGAGQVHAVEPDDSIEVARTLAAANGFSDRITFHKALCADVALPVPADVIVSDVRGVLPLFQKHIPIIADARQRLLAPGGALIPRRDVLWAALVEDPKQHRDFAQPWRANDLGLQLDAAYPLAINTWRKARGQTARLLGPPRAWATLDYTEITSPNVAGELAWSLERPGVAHGLLVWFDAELAPSIGFSNAPGEPKHVYGNAFFPLEEPVALSPGDRVEVDLRADLVGDDYVWRWRTRAHHDGKQRVELRQSTFFSEPLGAADLHKRDAAYLPALSDEALVTRFVLQQMDGATTLEEIARRVVEAFPGRLATAEQALARVRDLSAAHAR